MRRVAQNTLYEDENKVLWVNKGPVFGWQRLVTKDDIPGGGAPGAMPIIREVNAVTTITVNDFTIVFTQSGLTQALPNLYKGKILNIKNLSGGSITISAALIDTQNSVMLNDSESVQLQQRDNLGNYIVI